MNKKVLLFVIFFIGAMVFFAWIKLNQEVPPLTYEEKNKALEQMLGRKIKEEKIIPQGDNTYAGKFFSLSYPAYARLYDKKNLNITNNANVLESLRLDSEEPKFRFVLMVERADSTAVLEELSGVRVRRQNKSYQELPIAVDGKQGILFIKIKDGVERSSFFLKDGRSYSFSITGVDAGELEAIYGQIMKSVLLLK